MALSRNKRRLIAKLRSARKAADAANSAVVEARDALVRRNLSSAIRRESSKGLVTDYQLVIRPITKQRLRGTFGAANVGTSGGLPVS